MGCIADGAQHSSAFVDSSSKVPVCTTCLVQTVCIIVFSEWSIHPKRLSAGRPPIIYITAECSTSRVVKTIHLKQIVLCSIELRQSAVTYLEGLLRSASRSRYIRRKSRNKKSARRKRGRKIVCRVECADCATIVDWQ